MACPSSTAPCYHGLCQIRRSVRWWLARDRRDSGRGKKNSPRLVVLVDITRRCHDGLWRSGGARSAWRCCSSPRTAACVLTLAARADVDTFRGEPSSTVMDLAVGTFVLRRWRRAVPCGAPVVRLSAWPGLPARRSRGALVWHQAVLWRCWRFRPGEFVDRSGIVAAAVVVAAERVPSSVWSRFRRCRGRGRRRSA
jgi:hypothetical protein